MKHADRIKLVKDAINSVKTRMIEAIQAKRFNEASKLYYDLGGLERCLEIEAELAANHADNNKVA